MRAMKGDIRVSGVDRDVERSSVPPDLKRRSFVVVVYPSFLVALVFVGVEMGMELGADECAHASSAYATLAPFLSCFSASILPVPNLLFSLQIP